MQDADAKVEALHPSRRQALLEQAGEQCERLLELALALVELPSQTRQVTCYAMGTKLIAQVGVVHACVEYLQEAERHG